MKEIKLNRGFSALVDDEDYDYLNQWKWSVEKSFRTYYAQRCMVINKKRFHVRMHSIIMKTPKGLGVDHRDHNGLNCQRSNMRICTQKQNIFNRRSTCKSGYKGVYFDRKNAIVAKINVEGKQIHIGTFKTLKEAAVAYDEMAIRTRGEYAELNFKRIIV